jgi:hypothetical protein
VAATLRAAWRYIPAAHVGHELTVASDCYEGGYRISQLGAAAVVLR